MIGVLDAVKMGGAALIAGSLAFTAGYVLGKSDGRALERSAALERSMEAIKERSETNAEIDSLDDAALCRELGGEWVQPDTCQ